MIRNLCAIGMMGALVLACLGLGACSTPAPSPPRIETGTSDQEMIAFAAQWAEAFNAHDDARLAALYSDQAYVIAGQDAYPPKSYFKPIENRPSIHLARLEHGWYLFDKDVGFMEHKVEITETVDGVPKTRTLNFVLALRYRDGQWRIYGHHISEPLWPITGS